VDTTPGVSQRTEVAGVAITANPDRGTPRHRFFAPLVKPLIEL
jgi:hypothetical protein